MALINCPNCNNQISDKARKCPSCGIEFTYHNEPSNIPSTNFSYGGDRVAPKSVEESNYVLTLEYLDKNKFTEANETVEELLSTNPNNAVYTNLKQKIIKKQEEYTMKKRRSKKTTIKIVILLLFTTSIFTYFYLEEKAWDNVYNKKSFIAAQDYLKNFPLAPHRTEAKKFITEFKTLDDQEWMNAINIRTVQSITEYKYRNPEGQHIDEAEKTLESLLWESITKHEDNMENNIATYKKEFPNGIHIYDVNKIQQDMLNSDELDKVNQVIQDYFNQITNNNFEGLLPIFANTISYQKSKYISKMAAINIIRSWFDSNKVTNYRLIPDQSSLKALRDNKGNFNVTFNYDNIFEMSSNYSYTTTEYTYSNKMNMILTPDFKITLIRAEVISSFKKDKQTENAY